MSTHMKLSASGCSRWWECPGSIRMAEGQPNIESEFALEGTAAHALAEHVLKNPPANAFYYQKREHLIPNFPKGQKVTEEMADFVQGYVDYVVNLRNETKGDVLLEQKVVAKHIHPMLGGTADTIIKEHFTCLHVVDFKYGAGIAVEAKDNKQMRVYGVAAAYGEDFPMVKLHIYQPRAEHADGPVRVEEMKMSDLVEWSKELKQKAIATEDPKAPLKTGEHCRWCPGKVVCPAFKADTQLATAGVDVTVANPSFLDPVKLTDQQISKIIQNEATIKAWIESVKELALMRLRAGEKIEGVKLVAKRTSKEWLDEDKMKGALSALYGDEAPYEKKLLTVAKAEKLFGKGAIGGLFKLVDNGVTLASQNDRRREVVLAEVDFDEIKEIKAEDF